MLFGHTLRQLIDKLWPKTGNSLGFNFWFISVLFILYLPNVSKNSIMKQRSDQISEQHKEVLVSVD